MKKILLFLFVSMLIFVACSSDDDSTPAVVIVSPSITLDSGAVLARPVGSDITDIVNFGQPVGQSAAEYVSEVELNEVFVLGSPQGLQGGDEFLYWDIIFLDEDLQEVPTDNGVVDGKLEAVLPPGVTGTTVQDYYDQDYIEQIALRVIDVDDNDEIEWKYNIECYIRSGGDEIGPYFIDPKIKLKPRNN